MVFTTKTARTRGFLGKHHSLESRMKMSKAGKGRIFSEEHKRKIGLSRMGEKHPLWKGDKAKKGGAFHEWVRRRLIRPERCEMCHKIPKPRKDGKCALDLANISHTYSRDLSDWEWLCHKCHMNKDGTIQKLIEIRKNINYKGKNSPRWKGGIPKCIDCGKNTNGTYRATRCRSCYLKLKIRGKRGKYKNIL